MKFNNFFDLVDYAESNNMCTSPGCTTCGCLPFREFCKNEVGYEEMCRLISAVSEEEIKIGGHDIIGDHERWYEAIWLVQSFIFCDLPKEAPLIQVFIRLRNRKNEQIRMREVMLDRQQKERKELALIRRESRMKRVEEHRERSRNRADVYQREYP